MHKARLAARAVGCKFDNRDAALWLKPFVAKAQARRAAAPVAAPTSAPVLSTEQHLGSTGNGLTRGNCIPSLNLGSGSKEPSPSAAPPQRKRATRQGLLPLYGPRDEILKAVWQRVEPYIAATTCFSTWKRRNSVTAAELASIGWTPERLLTAWDYELRERGVPVRELSLLQKRIEDLSSKVVALRKAAEA